jgi:hypothetical protein
LSPSGNRQLPTGGPLPGLSPIGQPMPKRCSLTESPRLRRHGSRQAATLTRTRARGHLLRSPDSSVCLP